MLYDPQRRRGDGLFGRVFRFFKWFFIVMGVWATLSMISFITMTFMMQDHTAPSDKYLLTYTFKERLSESVPGPSFSTPLMKSSPTFSEMIEKLAAASADPHVKGFVAKLQNVSMSPAQLQELRDALAKFSAAGKPTYIYADSYGGFSGGMGAYYLASAFGQVWLQPIGGLAMNGIAAEVPFFKGVLDKIGVDPEFSRKGTYKSFPESFTLNGMSPANREMTTVLVNNLAGQFVSGIAASRGMKAEVVRKLVDDAPYDSEEALKLKLVDKLGFYDALMAAAKRKVDLPAGEEKDNTLALQDYELKEPSKEKAKIALIVGEGDITSYGGGSGMAADKIAAAFEDAHKDKNVAAVIFRIDSPGGSPEAAETIRHAIMKTQQDIVEINNGKKKIVRPGKPVIVSMSGYAASGGYWVAAAADKIVAEPATITGSIGVFGGKFVLSGLWQKLGVRWDSVTAGANAQMFSSNKAFTEAQLGKFESMLDTVYKAFIQRVAAGRHMTPEQVEAVAEGRVWTGQQAKSKGLVDELGGLDKAVALAKAAAKIPPGHHVPLRLFPEKKTPLETMFKLLSGEDDETDARAVILSLLGLDAASIVKNLKAEILDMPQVQVR